MSLDNRMNPGRGNACCTHEVKKINKLVPQIIKQMSSKTTMLLGAKEVYNHYFNHVNS